MDVKRASKGEIQKHNDKQANQKKKGPAFCAVFFSCGDQRNRVGDDDIICIAACFVVLFELGMFLAGKKRLTNNTKQQHQATTPSNNTKQHQQHLGLVFEKVWCEQSLLVHTPFRQRGHVIFFLFSASDLPGFVSLPFPPLLTPHACIRRTREHTKAPTRNPLLFFWCGLLLFFWPVASSACFKLVVARLPLCI